MSKQRQVANQGIDLPADFVAESGIRAGDRFEVIERDGRLVLLPVEAGVRELAASIERARLRAGVTKDDLLRAAAEHRSRFVADRYGPDPAALNG